MQFNSPHLSLSTTTNHQSLKGLLSQLKKFEQVTIKAFTDRSKLQVNQMVDGNYVWWYAYDPKTGKTIYTDSRTELMSWIEQNYQEV